MAIAIILGILFVVLAIVAGVLAYFAFDNANKAGGIVAVVSCIVLSLAFLCVPFSIRTVDAGEIAVVKEMGKIIDTREAGTHFDFWMTRSYEKYDTKVRQLDITTQSYSNDKQTMDVAMTVQYQVKPDAVKEIAKTYGGITALEGKIQSIAIERTKAMLSSYTADDIIMTRGSVSEAVSSSIETAVGDNYHVDITMVALTNIDFSDAYEQAVEAKMVAEQAKLQKDYENKAAEAAAETAKKVAEMQADAEAYAKEKAAEAEAKAIITKANAEAEALNIQTLEVARMFGLTEVVVKVDENNKPIQAINADGNLLYLDSKGNYTTEAKTNEVENEKVFVFIERIKPGVDTSIIAEYIEYIKYLESWNGEFPDTVVGDGVEVILPSKNS
jgi:regulator of protease activity HflC (stomatin/prohibitin superfamily)